MKDNVVFHSFYFLVVSSIQMDYKIYGLDKFNYKDVNKPLYVVGKRSKLIYNTTSLLLDIK